MRRAARCAIALLIGAVGLYSQTIAELKSHWKAGDYAGVLLPLIDYRFNLPSGSLAAEEADYMLLRAMCAMADHRDDARQYCRALPSVYGSTLRFEGARYNLDSVPCCAVEAGVRWTQSVRTWEQILKGIRDAAPPYVTQVVEVESTPQAMGWDRIVGFRVVSVGRNPGANSDYWPWSCRLEVDYTYNVAHGKVIVGAEAVGGGGLQSGHSWWGAPPPPETPADAVARKGMQRVDVAIRLLSPDAAAEITSLWLYLYEGNPPNRTIIRQRFPFRQTFK